MRPSLTVRNLLVVARYTRTRCKRRLRLRWIVWPCAREQLFSSVTLLVLAGMTEMMKQRATELNAVHLDQPPYCGRAR